MARHVRGVERAHTCTWLSVCPSIYMYNPKALLASWAKGPALWAKVSVWGLADRSPGLGAQDTEGPRAQRSQRAQRQI